MLPSRQIKILTIRKKDEESYLMKKVVKQEETSLVILSRCKWGSQGVGGGFLFLKLQLIYFVFFFYTSNNSLE